MLNKIKTCSKLTKGMQLTKQLRMYVKNSAYRKALTYWRLNAILKNRWFFFNFKKNYLIRFANRILNKYFTVNQCIYSAKYHGDFLERLLIQMGQSLLSMIRSVPTLTIHLKEHQLRLKSVFNQIISLLFTKKKQLLHKNLLLLVKQREKVERSRLENRLCIYHRKSLAEA